MAELDWRATNHFVPDEEPGDFFYDDGAFHGLVSIEGQTLTLHDVYVRDEALRDKRTGAGRAAMQRLRPMFAEIVVDGAMHPFLQGDNEGKHLSVLSFWAAMLREELVDRVILLQDTIVMMRRVPPPISIRPADIEGISDELLRADAVIRVVAHG